MVFETSGTSRLVKGVVPPNREVKTWTFDKTTANVVGFFGSSDTGAIISIGGIT